MLCSRLKCTADSAASENIGTVDATKSDASSEHPRTARGLEKDRVLRDHREAPARGGDAQRRGVHAADAHLRGKAASPRRGTRHQSTRDYLKAHPVTPKTFIFFSWSKQSFILFHCTTRFVPLHFSIGEVQKLLRHSAIPRRYIRASSRTPERRKRDPSPFPPALRGRCRR